MNIAMDISMIDSSKAGIPYYTYSLLKELTKTDETNNYYLYSNIDVSLDFKLPKNFVKVIVPAKKSGTIWMFAVVRDIKVRGIDKLISFSNLLLGVLFKNSYTFVHDLSPIIYPQFFPKKTSLLFKFYLNLLIKRKRTILTISHTVLNEIVRYSNGEANVEFVGIGIHDYIFQKSTDEQRRNTKTKYDLPEKFFLTVSTLEPRKNYENAIRGFALFSQTHPEYYYVIGGKKGWFFESIFKLVKELKIEEKVKFLGYIQEKDLISLYDLCVGYLGLSYYEGFGFPLVEAAIHGKPILASDIPVFRESLDDYAEYVDELNPQSISEGLEKVSQKSDINDKFYVSKYKWSEAAANLIDIMSENIRKK